MKYKIVYDSEFCGTQFVDEVNVESFKDVENSIDVVMYKEEMGLDEEDEAYVQIVSETDNEYEDY